MKLLKLSLLAAAATVAMSGAAFAQDEDTGPTVSFNFGAATDYVFRGISQTDEDPQAFIGADVAMDIFYAGAWASNVDFGDSTDGEVDLYVGVKPTLGPVTFDAAAIYYAYIDAPSGSDYDYWEFKGAGSVAAGPGTLGAAVYFSPDFFGGIGDAWYYEVNGSFPLAEKISVSGALGRQEIKGPGDYTTWNLGVGFAVTDNIGLDLRYHDTNEHSAGKLFDSRVVLGAKATF